MKVLNVLTVDVEDYFHVEAFANNVRAEDWDSYPLRVEANTRRLLDIFASRGVSATFFVLGWVAQRCPTLVREIAAAGHDVGCHGFAHQAIYRGSKQDFVRDLRRAKMIIENILGSPVTAYRAPSYSITAKTIWALDLLAEEGFEYDSSIFPIVHDLYGIPGAPRFPHVRALKNGKEIKEFPPSTLRLLGINFPVGGGGYFRLFPYSVTSFAIHRINLVENQPVMFYIHPWELDPEQPRLTARWLSRFRHYQNLASTETRLKTLLSEFEFSTLQKVFDSRSVPRIV